jgi:H+-transporting ATPase
VRLQGWLPANPWTGEAVAYVVGCRNEHAALDSNQVWLHQVWPNQVWPNQVWPYQVWPPMTPDAVDAPPTAAVAEPLSGLTGSEARRRLAENGANAMVDVVQRPFLLALKKLWAPVPWMLEITIVLQVILKDYVEAGIVGFLLLFNAALGFFQEGRAQATLDALKSKLALSATVFRDGTWTSVAASTLVVDDVIKISLGGIVAADVRVTQGSVLLDQSMLTGESLPVEAGTGSLAYAGALVRRGEATGRVTATGERTRFGHTAELIRTAKVESSQQKAIMRVVRNLALFNGCVTLLLLAYALSRAMPVSQIIPLMLIAVLGSIPVALPSMFTLAAAVGARHLAAQGVLPTRLSAVDEAGGIDILCADKTGTLTRNALEVMSIYSVPGHDDEHVLALAALASSDSSQDPVDTAIRLKSKAHAVTDAPTLVSFLAFDPETKRAEATARQADGQVLSIVKGAYATIETLTEASPELQTRVAGMEATGSRVLAVACGPPAAMKIVGLIALSDPPRDDSHALIAELSGLGVRTVMVTGDAEVTAQAVANVIGIAGATWAVTPLPENIRADAYGLFAGVLPEDKQRLVKALQTSGHIVGMCGDGANDAPALRQAQMGIAVSTATDVAKAAAGMVLTQPGLGGIVAAVKEGRTTYQRILTYTLRTVVHKTMQVMFLTIGLIVTGQAILTPMLMVLMMVTGDFLAMSSSTDTVRPSPTPNVWRIGPLTYAGLILGICDLLFCVACLCVGHYMLRLGIPELRTFCVVTLVFSGQAVFYVSRERQHIWSSVPGRWLIISSVTDLTIVSLLALTGILMQPLPLAILTGLLIAAIGLAFVLDTIKQILFRRFQIT